ncbi:MAK10-like protein [Tanacetum coccineum]|uniref:MAK10-like protein n=1 Tax=Tanacetum coccineum TaxID=301880 RepID=A0ABQ5E961_9ASTR
MEDPGLFTLPCRLGDSKPFDALADLGSCVNIIPLYLFKKFNIGLLEETGHIFRLADGTKAYPVRIVKDVEVHIGKLKLLNDFYVIDMKKDLDNPLLVGKRIPSYRQRSYRLVMVLVSNFIEVFAVVKNGIPRMKGLFSFSLMFMITKSVGPPMLQGNTQQAETGASTTSSFLGALTGSFLVLFSALFIASAFLTGIFIRDSAGRELLEKPEHFSHPTVDFLALLEDGVLESFHPFVKVILGSDKLPSNVGLEFRARLDDDQMYLGHLKAMRLP